MIFTCDVLISVVLVVASWIVEGFINVFVVGSDDERLEEDVADVEVWDTVVVEGVNLVDVVVVGFIDVIIVVAAAVDNDVGVVVAVVVVVGGVVVKEMALLVVVDGGAGVVVGFVEGVVAANVVIVVVVVVVLEGDGTVVVCGYANKMFQIFKLKSVAYQRVYQMKNKLCRFKFTLLYLILQTKTNK
jgi:hypothetical protein